MPVGGIADIVDDGKTGFLIKKDDKKALIEKIALLRSNNKLRTEMGLNGRKRIEDKFSIAKISNTVVEVMEKAALSKNGRH